MNYLSLIKYIEMLDRNRDKVSLEVLAKYPIYESNFKKITKLILTKLQ